MILVDTSVWIDHLQSGDVALGKFLERGEVLTHPFIVGEVSLGSLRQRAVVLDALLNLPQAIAAKDEEVRRFIDDEALHGLGIGYIDAHLLASTRLTSDASFWTRDKRLREVAERLSLAAEPK